MDYKIREYIMETYPNDYERIFETFDEELCSRLYNSRVLRAGYLLSDLEVSILDLENNYIVSMFPQNTIVFYYIKFVDVFKAAVFLYLKDENGIDCTLTFDDIDKCFEKVKIFK